MLLLALFVIVFLLIFTFGVKNNELALLLSKFDDVDNNYHDGIAFIDDSRCRLIAL